MRITRIVTIDTPNVKGKLLAACPIVNFGGKYLSGSAVFFSYVDGILKQYAVNDHTDTPIPTFKDALKYIQSL
jgi:hypothetical protein